MSCPLRSCSRLSLEEVILPRASRSMLCSSAERKQRKCTPISWSGCYCLCSVYLQVPPPSPADWAVVQRYSHRVKELKFFPLDKVSSCFLRAISSQPFLLFPNLKVLFWRSTTQLDCPTSLPITFLQCLLGPSLVSLNIFAREIDNAAFQPLLTNLLRSGVKSLSIAITASQQASIGSLSFPFPLSDYLECLLLHSSVDDVALRHIIMSPTLKELRLVLNPDQSRLHQVRLPSDITPFYNVKKMFLEVWDLQFVTSLMRNEGQIFHSLSLRSHSRPTIPEFPAFLTALGSRQRIYSLQSITLQSRYRESDLSQTATPAPLYDMLRPLTCLSHLRQLSIHLHDCLPINDDELISLARHWPHLCNLMLSASPALHEHPWELGKYITLKGLGSLVECCPQLQLLYLPLDAREVPADIPQRSTVVPPSVIILFSDSPINNPQLVANFLTRMFPSLLTVACAFESPRGDDEEILLYRTAWHRVETRLGELRSQHTGLVTGTSFFSDV